MKEYKGVIYLSQPEFREAILERFPQCSEEVIKYNYDRYTYFKGGQAIRKKATRKKVAQEAKYLNLDKNFLMSL